jgi:hypothetical protein
MQTMGLQVSLMAALNKWLAAGLEKTLALYALLVYGCLSHWAW